MRRRGCLPALVEMGSFRNFRFLAVASGVYAFSVHPSAYRCKRFRRRRRRVNDVRGVSDDIIVKAS